MALGDVHFTHPGRYFVDLSNKLYFAIRPPAGRTILCDAGVTIFETTNWPCGGNDSIRSLYNKGDTILGCDFGGGNTAAGPVQIAASQGPEVISVNNDNETIEGGTFHDSWGNSAVQVSSSYTNHDPTGFTIGHNTFRHNPYYAVSVASAKSGIVEYNYSEDGAFGHEPSGLYVNTGVLWRANYARTIVGGCRTAGQPGCALPSAAYSAWSAAPVDFSSDTFTCNYCAGNLPIDFGWANYAPGWATMPYYHHQMLGPGCSCYAAGCDSGNSPAADESYCNVLYGANATPTPTPPPPPEQDDALLFTALGVFTMGCSFVVLGLSSRVLRKAR